MISRETERFSLFSNATDNPLRLATIVALATILCGCTRLPVVTPEDPTALAVLEAVASHKAARTTRDSIVLSRYLACNPPDCATARRGNWDPITYDRLLAAMEMGFGSAEYKLGRSRADSLSVELEKAMGPALDTVPWMTALSLGYPQRQDARRFAVAVRVHHQAQRRPRNDMCWDNHQYNVTVELDASGKPAVTVDDMIGGSHGGC